MRNLLIILIVFFCLNPLFSQHEQADFQTTARAGVGTTFAEDYNALGINAANLAKEPFFQDKKLTLGFMAFNTTVFTAPLSKEEAIGAFGGNEKLTYEEKVENALVFVGEPVSINVDYVLLGASYHHPDIGGFAFTVRDKVQWYSKFDENAAELMFLGFNSQYFDLLEIEDANGQTQIIQNGTDLDPEVRDQIIRGILGDTSEAVNFSTIIGDTDLSMVAYREYAFGYGREIFSTDDIKLEGGLGLKYITGFNMTEIRNREGDFEAYGAFAPLLDIDFGSAAVGNPTAINDKSFGLGGPAVVGRGFGFDLGFSFEYKKRTNIGIALNNIGFIRWDKNLYQATNDDLIDLDNGGFESLNFFTEVQKFGGDDGLFNWVTGEARTVNLPANFRIGASQEIANTFHVGMDAIFPVNDLPGSIDRPIISVGGDFTPLKLIRASTGFTYGGNFGSRVLVPLGCSVMIAEGSWEIGVATRDIVTFFRQKGPVISAGFGFMKFRI
jgi:hypothetical protein